MMKLDAINSMLMYVGLPPIATLQDCDNILPAAQALIALDLANQTGQSRGWIFNTDKQITLALATDEIPLPANALNVINNPSLVKRGTKIYDTDNNTYKFTLAQVVNLVSEVNFDDLPTSAQRYILALATREFSMSQTASSSADQLLGQRVREALSDLMQIELDAEPIANLIDTSKAVLTPNDWRNK